MRWSWCCLAALRRSQVAVVGAVVYKTLNIWLVSQTDWSKLVLGAFIVLIVVAFPKGIVGVIETIRLRLRRPLVVVIPHRVEAAESAARRPLLSVEGLTKSYGGVHAVRNVSFALHSGEIRR